MPRPQRLDFHGAIHHVRVRGRSGGSVFFEAKVLDRHPKDYWANAPYVRRFLVVLGEPLAECGAQLYGYCVMPNDAWLVVQTRGASLDRFMQRVGGAFSRYWRALVKGDVRGPFAGRYASKVIAPEYLPHAVRRIHASPYAAGLRWQGMGYPFSSEQAYLGGQLHAPLHREVMLSALEEKGFVGVRGYREFMRLEDSPHVAQLFARGSAEDPRIVGSRGFVVLARDRAAHPPPAVSRDELIAAVAALLKVPPKAIFSATREGVLGRSLAAWYGVREGAGTLSEIGRWFSVSVATLGRGIRYYRRRKPDYFAQTGLLESSHQYGTRFHGKRRREI